MNTRFPRQISESKTRQNKEQDAKEKGGKDGAKGRETKKGKEGKDGKTSKGVKGASSKSDGVTGVGPPQKRAKDGNGKGKGDSQPSQDQEADSQEAEGEPSFSDNIDNMRSWPLSRLEDYEKSLKAQYEACVKINADTSASAWVSARLDLVRAFSFEVKQPKAKVIA